MSQGLLHSAQSLLAGLLALARTRLELFGTELQEELTRLFLMLLGAVAVLLLTALGLAFAAAAFIAALGEDSRILAAAAIGVAFLVAALAAGWGLRRVTRAKTRLFSASLAELARDREALLP